MHDCSVIPENQKLRLVQGQHLSVQGSELEKADQLTLSAHTYPPGEISLFTPPKNGKYQRNKYKLNEWCDQ